LSKKYFTVEEANGLLPVVKAEIDKLQDIKSRFEGKVAELRKLKLLHRNQEQPQQEKDPYFVLECELEFLQIEFKQVLSGFERQGIEVKDVDTGLVDFPALYKGEEVLLCWKKGESAVAHYHGLYDGFIGRKPLDGSGLM
jgi:hypothetical protein